MSTIRRSFKFGCRHADQDPDDTRWPLEHPATLIWQADQPHIVSATLAGTSWEFGWELLTAGLDGPAGQGDVFICPLPGTKRHEIVLDTPDGHAAIQFRTDPLRKFVDAVTPLWAELPRDDAEYAALLDGAAS